MFSYLDTNDDILLDSELKIIADKKCKKQYLKFTKNITRGVALGIKQGMKEVIDNLDLSCLETTSSAVSYIINS